MHDMWIVQIVGVIVQRCTMLYGVRYFISKTPVRGSLLTIACMHLARLHNPQFNAMICIKSASYRQESMLALLRHKIPKTSYPLYPQL
ncbi:hypothetical protein CC80DRAFT_490108 [Byssothecium circinans]|uniref:Uncharacterized protein n=1 Tax=Byssothecium circinans TaxID=147558 RepID=A0A6A5U2Q0_9PLEO|nr:hypothetical protein CC80DRAFT_490108 [Byssothecium circinans]